MIRIARKLRYAHRVYYEARFGPILEHFVVDHLCQYTACVNPDPLEAVVPRENLRRTQRTHCVNGHPFTEDNIYLRPDNGNRACRACYRERSRARCKGTTVPERVAQRQALIDFYDHACLRCGRKGKVTADHVIPLCQRGPTDITTMLF